MKNVREKIFLALKDFVECEQVKQVLESSSVDEKTFFILNPQLDIKLYMSHGKELIVPAKSNGKNGFTEFQKTYPLK